MNKKKIRKILMQSCYRRMNEERKKVTKEVLEFRDLLTVSCFFFSPYSSVLDTYQLEFHQILEISQDKIR